MAVAAIKSTSSINSINFPELVRPTDHEREVNQDLGESPSNHSVGWSDWYSSEVWSAISFILAQAPSMEKSLQWRADTLLTEGYLSQSDLWVTNTSL